MARVQWWWFSGVRIRRGYCYCPEGGGVVVLDLPDKVDGAERYEGRGRKRSGDVADAMSIRLNVDVVQEDNEAEEQHGQQANECVVDDCVQQDQYQPATDQHPRPAQAVAVVFLRGHCDDVIQVHLVSKKSTIFACVYHELRDCCTRVWK